MFRFPEGLYADIRTERIDNACFSVQNGEVKQNSETSVSGAIIRVYDGKMWYTSVTNDLESIQSELDSLASVAEPDPAIADHPAVKLYEVHKDKVLHFDGDKDIRKVTRPQREALLNGYIEKCVDPDIPEIKQWYASYFSTHSVKEFYSSKGAEIVSDYQQCFAGIWFDFVVDGVTTSGGKYYGSMFFDDLKGHEDGIIARRDRYLDFAKNAVDAEPGGCVCVLAPDVTGMFTHECFGHKSEADQMLSDQTLRDEWIMGKKVGSELVSICDSGDMFPHRGYIAYDDEGTAVKETWLIRDGVLTGRLHDANSASVLGEDLTGNARAQDFSCAPMVRMTNTYMKNGTTPPEEIIAGVKDGIYVYNVQYGTGLSTFTMKPSICYRIRDGKLAEPLRVNVITGSVFQTLFDIDAVGNDLRFCDTSTCGKRGQSMPVSDAGPTIRVRSLNVN
ncbi:MAG: TldD/PmbA family protein [Ruminococcus sp.]|nr:TldD/PmbA family protein [Ruminococcus sp.]